MLQIPSGEGPNNRRTEAERVARALTSLPVGRGLVRLEAEAFVSHLIEELPLNTEQRRTILPGSEPSLLNTFALLGAVPHASRMAFFSEVVNRALSSGRRKELPFLAAVLTQAGHWLSAIERRKLLLQIGAERPSGATAKCWVALARSASSTRQVHRVMHACDRDRLLSSGSRELKEFLVTIEALTSFRAIHVPQPPSPHATNSNALTTRARELRQGIDQAQAILKAMSWAKGTTRYARLNSMLKSSKQILEERLGQTNSAGENNRELRTQTERVRLELQFGKLLSHDATRPWTEPELRVVRSALEETGEFRNICSSVYEIKRVAELDEACAIITNCGTRIELEDRCFAGGKSGSEVRAGCSPEEVVIHELGHGFSMVPVDAVLRRVRKTGGANVNDQFVADHFPEIYLRLGRWGGMVSGFEVRDSGEVVIQGKPVTLGAPVKMNGELRVYQYTPAYRCLYWYGYPAGEFPRRLDSRADPTEQLTEGFSDYYRAPEELIECAPNLFWYFESIYHRYDGDANIFERLKDRLKNKTMPTPREVPAEVDAFSLLSRREQMGIIERADLMPRRWETKTPSPREREALFLKIVSRGEKQRAVSKLLHEALAEYNPALLIARTHLFTGHDVAVVSIRGSSSADTDTQETLRDELELLLGPRFDRKGIFLLNDARRSERYGKGASYHQKVVSLVTERLLGFAPRSDGQHKRLQKKYERVVLFTDMQPTADYVRKFARNHKLTDAIEVVSPRDTDSRQAARTYLTTPWGQAEDAQKVLYLFSLEDLVSLPAAFHVRLREGRVMKTVTLKQFLLRPQPHYWISITADQNPAYRKKDFVFDDSEFTSEAALLLTLKEGREEGQMLKAFATYRASR